MARPLDAGDRKGPSNLLRRYGVALALFAAGAFVYRPVWSGRVAAGREIFRLYVPDGVFLLEAAARLELPLWTTWERLGQPFAAALITEACYPPRLLSLLAGPWWAVTLQHLFHVLVAAVGTYAAARSLRIGRLASGFSAFAFALGPMFTHLASQPNVVAAVAWTGALVASRERRSFPLFVLLSLLAGSPETTLWQLALVAAVALARGVRSGLRLVLPVALGAGLAAFALVPAAELAVTAGRVVSADEALVWSVPPVGLASMVWFQIDLPRGDYWRGDQSFVLSLFLGTLTAALAAVALYRPRRTTVALAVAAAALAALSLGAYFLPSALVLKVPPLNLFRYPAKYVVGAAFALCLLSGRGLDRLAAIAQRVRRARKPVLVTAAVWALGCGAGLALLPWLREGARAGLAWGAVFLAAGAGAFFAAPAPRRWAKVRSAVLALASLELLAAHALLGMPAWLPASALSTPSPLAAKIPGSFQGRISVDLSGDHAERVGERYIERSREALVPLRFAEEHLRAVEGYGAPAPRRLAALLEGRPRAAYDLAGVEYFVRRGEAPFPDLSEVAAFPDLPSLFHSETAMPRAFVVHRSTVVEDEAALAAVRAEEQPFRETVYLAEGAAIDDPSRGCSTARVRPTERQNALEIDVHACADGYLVITDAWAPGWRATVDGDAAEVVRANYLVRAVRVPAGEHEVQLRYRPLSWVVGAALSLLAAAGYAAWARWKKGTVPISGRA